ncbi:Glyceraldehyde-3-phosphate dehydrogenase [Psidium guajava]|nr:Glyceraldehyde-3-phosphate dehydrogenase [Psidium guajava]
MQRSFLVIHGNLEEHSFIRSCFLAKSMATSLTINFPPLYIARPASHQTSCSLVQRRHSCVSMAPRPAPPR